MAPLIRVGSIDDDMLMRQTSVLWWAQVPDVDLVATAATVTEFLTISPAVDVVMLDLRLDDESEPAENVERLVAAGHKVLVVSMFSAREHRISTLRAGAQGYLTKDNDSAALLTALREVATDTHDIGAELAFAISRDRSPDVRLARREREAVTLYAQGHTRREVAAQMNIADSTVRSHLERVKEKYTAAGRPTSTRSDIQHRLREDGRSPL